MLENENLNEPQTPQLNIGDVSGSDLFKKYLKKDPEFSGNLNFNNFEQIGDEYNIYNFIELLKWFDDKNNAQLKDMILREAGICLETNKAKAIDRIRSYKSELKRKPPRLSSFEYLGTFHEH